MTSNYPPGVTGSEWQISGEDRPDLEGRFCDLHSSVVDDENTLGDPWAERDYAALSCRDCQIATLTYDHRECGKPKYDGCFSHLPGAHCRACGVPWPCDVERIRDILESSGG